MSKAREMLLLQARDQWVAIRAMRHATENEKQLAEVMIGAANEMLDEVRGKTQDPSAAQGGAIAATKEITKAEADVAKWVR